MSSNIPEARVCVDAALGFVRLGMCAEAETLLARALPFMTRAPAKRRAAAQRREYNVTPDMRAMIQRLKSNPQLTNADIAEAVGWPACASGRVSEVLHGLR